LTTYVGFSEARAAGDRVQIKGKIDKASVHFDSSPMISASTLPMRLASA